MARRDLTESLTGRLTGLVRQYEKALTTLTPDQQQAVILRIEFGFTYPEIATALGRGSGNSVRMQGSRST